MRGKFIKFYERVVSGTFCFAVTESFESFANNYKLCAKSNLFVQSYVCFAVQESTFLMIVHQLLHPTHFQSDNPRLNVKMKVRNNIRDLTTDNIFLDSHAVVKAK